MTFNTFVYPDVSSRCYQLVAQLIAKGERVLEKRLKLREFNTPHYTVVKRYVTPLEDVIITIIMGYNFESDIRSITVTSTHLGLLLHIDLRFSLKKRKSLREERKIILEKAGGIYNNILTEEDIFEIILSLEDDD